MKPYLRDKVPALLDEIPENTSYEAGYLVTKNSGRRSQTPVVDSDKCVGCLECYLYCPDGCIIRESGEGKKEKVAVDLDFCKGCKICAKVCPVKAISFTEG